MKIFDFSTREGYGQFVSFAGIGGRFKSDGTVDALRRYHSSNVVAAFKRCL